MNHSKKVVGMFAVSGVLTSFVPSAGGFADDTLAKALSFAKRIVEYRNQLDGYRKVANDFASYRKDYLSNDDARRELKEKEKVLRVVVEMRERWDELRSKFSNLEKDGCLSVLRPKELQAFLSSCDDFFRFLDVRCMGVFGDFENDYVQRIGMPLSYLCGILKMLRYLEILDQMHINLDDHDFDFIKSDSFSPDELDDICKLMRTKVENLLLRADPEDWTYDKDKKDWVVKRLTDEILELSFLEKYSYIVNADTGLYVPEILIKYGWGKNITESWEVMAEDVGEMLYKQEAVLRLDCVKCQRTIDRTQLKAREYKRYIDWRRGNDGDGSDGINHSLKEPQKFIEDLFEKEGFGEVLSKLQSNKLGDTRENSTGDCLSEHSNELLELQKLAKDPMKAEENLLEQFKFDHAINFDYRVCY